MSCLYTLCVASHYPFAFSYYTTAIPIGDASPNSSAPSPSRIAQPEGLANPADAIVLWVGDTGSITLSLWYAEATSGEWLPLGGSRTITSSGGPVYIPIPAAVPIFAQIASVSGGAMKFGIGFTSGDISAATTVVTSGTQAADVVVDQGLGPPVLAGTIAGAGTAMHPWAAQTTPAYLTLNAAPGNTNPVYYYDGTAASGVGLPIFPGQSRQVRLMNPSLSFAYVSTNDTCGWSVER